MGEMAGICRRDSNWTAVLKMPTQAFCQPDTGLKRS